MLIALMAAGMAAPEPPPEGVCPKCGQLKKFEGLLCRECVASLSEGARRVDEAKRAAREECARTPASTPTERELRAARAEAKTSAAEEKRERRRARNRRRKR